MTGSPMPTARRDSCGREDLTKVLQSHLREVQIVVQDGMKRLEHLQREQFDRNAELVRRMFSEAKHTQPQTQQEPQQQTEQKPSRETAVNKAAEVETKKRSSISFASEPCGDVSFLETETLPWSGDEEVKQEEPGERPRSALAWAEPPSTPHTKNMVVRAPSRQRETRSMKTIIDLSAMRRTTMGSLASWTSVSDLFFSSDQGCGRLERFMKSNFMNGLVSILIIANALYMGIHTEQALSCILHDRKPMHPAWETVESAFCMFFLGEIILRMAAERLEFVIGPEALWNCFDTLIVCLSAVDMVLTAFNWDSPLNLTFGRTIRIFRFARILRIVRVMRSFHSFRVMVYSIFYSASSLCWVFLLLLFVLYFFATFFLHGVIDYFKEPGDYEGEELALQLQLLYGSLPDTLLSLFLAITGGMDWVELKQPLSDMHWMYGSIFVMYIFFMMFGVLNVVIGTFVDSAQRISQRDREIVTQGEIDKVKKYSNQLRNFFHEADTDNSDTISWEEFQAYLQDPKVQAYFRSFELDVSQAHALFELLDADGSNDVGIDEFIDGCTRMKGAAQSVDVNMLMYETRKFVVRQQEFMDYVNEQFTKVLAMPQYEKPRSFRRSSTIFKSS